MKWLPSSERQFVEVLLETGSINNNIGCVRSHENRFSSFSFGGIFLKDPSFKGSIVGQIVVDVSYRSVVLFLVPVDLGVVVPLSGLGVLSVSDVELGDFFGGEFSIEDLEGVPRGESMRFFSYMNLDLVIKYSLLA
jgi:hypothetical protein